LTQNFKPMLRLLLLIAVALALPTFDFPDKELPAALTGVGFNHSLAQVFTASASSLSLVGFSITISDVTNATALDVRLYPRFCFRCKLCSSRSVSVLLGRCLRQYLRPSHKRQLGVGGAHHLVT
jgi:hypothetical protein